MARQKLKKFAESKERANILEEGKALYHQIKGKWKEEHFQNENDIIIELACGRGEYSTGLASVYPDKNFIGIDVKGDRLWYGSNVAIENELNNVAFLRCQILQLSDFFEENEVAEIWIIHPDPRPKKKDAKRRLTHPRFLEVYKHVLQPNGLVRFKTDNRPLFDYSLEVLEEEKIEPIAVTTDLYESDLLEEHHGIETRYEKKFSALGHKINYLKFRFPV